MASSSAGCFLGCAGSPNGEEDEESSEEKCDNCDIIACSKECMKLHKNPEDHQSMLSSESQKAKFFAAWTQFHYFMDCIQCRFG